MSSLLEILGRAIAVDVADLIWHWLNTVRLPKDLDESPKRDHLSRIVELMAQLKLDTATEQLRLYLFENPSCIFGRMAAAAICLRNNRLEEAIEELNSVYMRQPNNTMALYALGHCYERIGKQSQAVEFYQDCLKFKNYLQLPAQRLGAIYFKDRRVEKAIEQYEVLKAEYPDDITALVTLGQLYIASARYADAAEVFNTAILIHPDNFETSDQPEVDMLISEGQMQEALELIEGIVETQPHRADLLARRADLLAMLGATTEAVSQYEEALRLCPDFLEATIKLGTLLLQLGNDQAAAEQFNKAIEINDGIVEAYIGLATAYKLAGDNTDALQTLSLAGAIQPNSSLLFAELANIHFKAARQGENPYEALDEREDLMDRVITAHNLRISHHPQNPDSHYRLAVLLMSLGRFDQAVKSLEAALEINPLYGRARTKLAVCLFETNKAQQALGHLAAPEPLDPDTLNLHYKTALLYCNRVKFASSLMNLERIMEATYTRPAAAENISIVLQNLGILDRAGATWDTLVEMANHSPNSGPPPEPAL
ncbi:MAG: tetratricopeptide repeat protein [Sedimentisphaerales bacterium]|nr:tetratricopeptide repeat protein [Sedimentisphaerales bacterium]